MQDLRATQEMCAVCFDVLSAKLNNQAIDPVVQRFLQTEPLASQPCPVFITWKIGPSKDLRGCIGTFDGSKAIGQVVPEYALVSALKDSRFPPISARELPQLSVSVSLLTNFTDIQDPLGWEIGVHGIQIEFRANGRRYSGTFLPEVAKQQGWDQATTLIYLFNKAGYKTRSPNPMETIDQLRPQLKVTTYMSSKLSMNFETYQKYRNNQQILQLTKILKKKQHLILNTITYSNNFKKS